MNDSVWDRLDYTDEQLLTKKEKSTKSSEAQGVFLVRIRYVKVAVILYGFAHSYVHPSAYVLCTMCCALQISCLRKQAAVDVII